VHFKVEEVFFPLPLLFYFFSPFLLPERTGGFEGCVVASGFVRVSPDWVPDLSRGFLVARTISPSPCPFFFPSFIPQFFLERRPSTYVPGAIGRCGVGRERIASNYFLSGLFFFGGQQNRIPSPFVYSPPLLRMKFPPGQVDLCDRFAIDLVAQVPALGEGSLLLCPPFLL